MTESTAAPKNIILCATQRCGSTMICEDMWNTGVLGRPEEYFIPWDPARTDVNWAEAWQSIGRRAASPNGVWAIKVMANQLPLVEGCIQQFQPPGELLGQASLYPAFRQLFKDALWVFIVRDDLVGQAISQVISRQTGVNHATAKADDEHFAGNLMRGYQGEYNAKVQFNHHALKRRMWAVTRENAIWRAFFKQHGIKPLTLRYEDVVNDFPGYLHALAGHAGLPLEASPPPRKLVQLANQVNKEWRDRLIEILAAEPANG